MIDRPVRMCVCFNKTFRELKLAGVTSLPDVVERFRCTTGCGQCKPYIELMLATGETEFAVLEPAAPRSDWD